MKELVLQIKFGGLGDHLFYSHLPKIAKEVGGFDKVFISKHSALPAKEIQRVIWELNPYVDGFSDQPGVSAPVDLKLGAGMNLLDAVMLSVGLDDGKRFHEPEIYYKPKLIAELQNKNIYFPNFISNAGFLSGPKVGKYFKDQNIHIDYQGSVREKESSVVILDFDAYLKTVHFTDFVDAIFSANNVYCLVTGTASLGPSLGKRLNVFHSKEIAPEFLHSRLNNYICL